MINFIENTLLRGDPMSPQCNDLIAQTGRLDVGQPVPDGWRVLDGNMRDSLVARVVLRMELENEE